ncbi:MAG: hypothetical protein A2Z96_01990 [Spirochaetes bacterium GWB1_48_6]|nr:MAG: hypothetical protein A2Z96_01990 [Spirochaetes bacterium GWB1_48_6]
MGLGITDTVSSIALAMVPPGNVVRSIVEIRRAFWTELGVASARAYFDVPVLTWLAEPLDGATLAGLASRCAIPFELTGLERQGDDVFLRFPAEHAACISELTAKMPIAETSSEYRPGPFEAGLGCFCASLSGLMTSNLPLIDRIAVPPIHAKTYFLALLELRWVPGLSFSSSWATLSSARSGRNIH